MILRKIKPEQIISLRLNGISFSKMKELTSSIIFKNVISLTLLNYESMNSIKEYKKYFPNLIRFCLRYDDEINFNLLNNICSQLWSSIKRFEIRSAEPICKHYEFNMGYSRNYTIEYVLLDIRYLPLDSIYECWKYKELCFLMTIIDFIEKIHNVQHVHFIIINEGSLKKLLNADEWMELANTCHQLKKITLQVMGSILEDQQLTKKIIEIQRQLHYVRTTIQFQVIFM